MNTKILIYLLTILCMHENSIISSFEDFAAKHAEQINIAQQKSQNLSLPEAEKQKQLEIAEKERVRQSLNEHLIEYLALERVAKEKGVRRIYADMVPFQGYPYCYIYINNQCLNIGFPSMASRIFRISSFWDWYKSKDIEELKADLYRDLEQNEFFK